MKANNWLILAVPVLALLGRFAFADNVTQVIGFVEESQQSAWDAAKKKSESRMETNLRVSFMKHNGKWTSLCPVTLPPDAVHRCESKTSPQPTNWLVVHNGKEISQIKSGQRVRPNYSVTASLYGITSPNVPHVGEPDTRFSGWTGNEVHRPLVAVSRKQYRDVDGWKETRSTTDIDLIWPHFQKMIGGAVKSCEPDKDGNPVEKTISLKKPHMTVRYAFVARDGRRLLSAVLDPNVFQSCEGVMDKASSDHLFFVNDKKQVSAITVSYRHADTNAVYLEPIEFGDYDGNGKSEAVFWLSSYNEDGYILIPDNFSEAIAFIWIYH